MKPEELEQLLGGYATGTLTPEEQRALFEAALRDQKLFDALAREQALREAFGEPAVRRELLADLEQVRPTWREKLAAWFHPGYPIAAGALAVAALITVVTIVKYTGPEPLPATQVAELRAPVQPEPYMPAVPAVPPPKPAAVTPKRKILVEVPPAALRDAVAPPAANKAPAPEAASGVVGGVIGGIVGGAPTAAPPPPPAAAVAETARSERQAFKASAPKEARDLALPGLSLRHLVTESGQFTVEASADSVIYVFLGAGPDRWMPITPGGLSLRANVPATIPGLNATSSALLVLSRRPLPQLAQTGDALSATLQKLQAEGSRTPGLVVVNLPSK